MLKLVYSDDSQVVFDQSWGKYICYFALQSKADRSHVKTINNKVAEATSVFVSPEDSLLDFDPSFEPSDDYLNIHMFTRQVIHNWFYTGMQDPDKIPTHDKKIMKGRKLVPQSLLDGDTQMYCEEDFPESGNSDVDDENFELSNHIITLGVKVRDFAYDPSTRQSTATAVNQYPPVTIFNAYTKCCYFFYLRWLYKVGIYDRPCIGLTTQDVDRLLTCGAIDMDMLDFPMGRAMAAYGAYTRCSGTRPPRSAWTVKVNAPCRPSQEEFSQFATYIENTRFLNAGKRVWPFRFDVRKRPKIPEDYEEGRERDHGLWGLSKTMGISDEDCLKLFQNKDKSFVDPKVFASRSDLVWSRNGEPCKKVDMYTTIKHVQSPTSPVQNTTAPETPAISPFDISEDLTEVDEEPQTKPIKLKRSASKFFHIPKRIVMGLFAKNADEDEPVFDDPSSSPCRSRHAPKDSKRFWSTLTLPIRKPLQPRSPVLVPLADIFTSDRNKRDREGDENDVNIGASSPTKKRRLQPTFLSRRRTRRLK